MFIPVGLDVGYGYTKLVTAEKQITFPSIIGRAERLDYQLEGLKSETAGSAIPYNKRAYFVGEWAQRQSAMRFELRDRGWIESDLYRVLILAAFTQAGLLDHPCALVTGLPVDYYADRHKVIEIFNGRQMPNNIQAERVRVIPQPFGTLFDLLLNLNGSMKDETFASQSIGIIDVGHHTTDCIRVDDLTYIERDSRSTHGMSIAFEAIAREMKAKMALSLTPDRFVERMIRRWIEHPPSRPPRFLADLVRSTLEDLADQIAAFAKTLWSQDEFPDRVILTGGGAHLIGSLLKERIIDLIVAPDPHLANVRGYFKYSQRLFGGSQ